MTQSGPVKSSENEEFREINWRTAVLGRLWATLKYYAAHSDWTIDRLLTDLASACPTIADQSTSASSLIDAAEKLLHHNRNFMDFDLELNFFSTNTSPRSLTSHMVSNWLTFIFLFITHTDRLSNSFSLILLCFFTSSTSNCAPCRRREWMNS